MRQVLVCGSETANPAAAHRLRRLLQEADRIMLVDASRVHTCWPPLRVLERST